VKLTITELIVKTVVEEMQLKWSRRFVHSGYKHPAGNRELSSVTPYQPS